MLVDSWSFKWAEAAAKGVFKSKMKGVALKFLDIRGMTTSRQVYTRVDGIRLHVGRCSYNARVSLRYNLLLYFCEKRLRT